ncbi:hypothetical protein IWX90DRAFT_421400 [Phyllosticta citrichinensis]|uniref:Secreted protein n=1 Tax=Phyllosticta citrichinensis TaxID=1130410 RepID=A0ABR1Y7C8_9PEZI
MAIIIGGGGGVAFVRWSCLLLARSRSELRCAALASPPSRSRPHFAGLRTLLGGWVGNVGRRARPARFLLVTQTFDDGRPAIFCPWLGNGRWMDSHLGRRYGTVCAVCVPAPGHHSAA